MQRCRNTVQMRKGGRVFIGRVEDGTPFLADEYVIPLCKSTLHRPRSSRPLASRVSSSKEKVDKTIGMKNKKGKAVAAKFQTGPGQVSREETCARTHTSTRARAHTRWRWRDGAVVRCSGGARTRTHAQRLSRTRSFCALVWWCAGVVVRWERLAALRCHLLAAASSFVSPCVGFLVRTHIRHICARARSLSLSSLSPLSLLSLYSLLSPRSNTVGRRTTLPRRRMTS